MPGQEIIKFLYMFEGHLAITMFGLTNEKRE